MNYLELFKRFDRLTLIFIDKKGLTLKKEIQINSLSKEHYKATERENKHRFFMKLDGNVIFFHGWNIPIYTPRERQMNFSAKGVFYLTGKSLKFVGQYIEKNAKGDFNKGEIIFVRNLKNLKQEILLFPGVYSANKKILDYKLQQELAEEFAAYERKVLRDEVQPPNIYERWNFPQTAAA